MRSKQLSLNIYKGQRGGRRPNSGRKRLQSKGVAHRIREHVNHRTPMHINFKFRKAIRNKDCLKLLKRAILNSRRHGLRVIHFSLQHNHIHLIVEAETNHILTRAMRSLTVTFAKGLKQGRVQIERYHLHVLKSIRETRNVIHYVVFNKQKHEKGTCSTVDEYGSLLTMANAKEWIKEFARKNRLTMKVGKCDWQGDQGRSWIIKKALILEGPKLDV